MITLGLFTIVALVALLIAGTILVVGGSLFLVVFADVIVAIFVIWLLIKFFRRNKRKK